MRLLIVDDNKPLAEVTAELLQWIDQSARHINSITLAGDLDSAIRLLPQHDAVLCDGEFPISRESLFAVEEWDVIWGEACRRGIHFVLYSGCSRALEDAREGAIPAISKPAAIEEIYAALTECLMEAQPVTIAGNPGE